MLLFALIIKPFQMFPSILLGNFPKLCTRNIVVTAHHSHIGVRCDGRALDHRRWRGDVFIRTASIKSFCILLLCRLSGPGRAVGNGEISSLNAGKAAHWIRCFGLVVSDGPDRYNKICTHRNAFVCRLGCPEFTWPVDRPTPETGSSRSLFIPESAIYRGHPRFATLTSNIRQRRGERVAINIPSKYFKFLSFIPAFLGTQIMFLECRPSSIFGSHKLLFIIPNVARPEPSRMKGARFMIVPIQNNFSLFARLFFL